MAGRASTTDGIKRAIYAANPHLNAGRDNRAAERLAMAYWLTDALHARIEATEDVGAKVATSKDMDEYHKLYADALRLEQELGITPAARQRQGISSGSPAGLPGAKA